MKPLIVLLIVFLISTGIAYMGDGDPKLIFSGNLSMAIMLFFTAMAHFKFTNGMVMTLPAFVPAKRFLIYFTGLLEAAFGILILIPACRHITGIALIIFFILLLPANIYGAIKRVNLEKGNYTGKGLRYLWLRIPLQIFFIAWVWTFTVDQTIEVRQWNLNKDIHGRGQSAVL